MGSVGCIATHLLLFARDGVGYPLLLLGALSLLRLMAPLHDTETACVVPVGCEHLYGVRCALVSNRPWLALLHLADCQRVMMGRYGHYSRIAFSRYGRHSRIAFSRYRS